MRLTVILLLLLSPAHSLRAVELPRVSLTQPQQCTGQRLGKLRITQRRWLNRIANQELAEDANVAAAIRYAANLCRWQIHIDTDLNKLLNFAGTFTSLTDLERSKFLGNYLRLCQLQIDFCGRLRYLSRDKLLEVAESLENEDKSFIRLTQVLSRLRSSTAADALSYALFDPSSKNEGSEAFSVQVKLAVLDLFAAANRIELLETLAEFVKQRGQRGAVVIRAAEVIRQLGLPQDPHPSHPEWVAKPSITAQQLLAILDRHRVTGDLLLRRQRLRDWLTGRIRHGIRGNTLRLGQMTLQVGDWFLMKNPSPYNEFTNVSPGLFTHVGIVTTTTSAKGVRRFVISDLPERGSRVPAINVDAYLERTLHYVFLRHPNKRTARKLGQVAASLIGRPSQFDLTFQTKRVEQMRGRLGSAKTVHTYCAGFLLLCAQETDSPLYHFFPLTERTASGHCVANLKKLGISFGKNFVSPTGPLFSRTLIRVGMREPTYSPLREVKNAIYSHFCQRMRTKAIRPAPTALQRIRQNLANLSKYNPWLAKALAKASNVSENMDLAAAARAAAVIETLDEIARRAAEEFSVARTTIGDSESDSINILPQRFRQRHADLFRRWRNDQLTSRDLRVELTKYYAQFGKRQLDQRFFPP